MRTQPRPRRQVPRGLLMVLHPALRYSDWRDAYVLRGIGESRGPVLQVLPHDEPSWLRLAQPAVRHDRVDRPVHADRPTSG